VVQQRETKKDEDLKGRRDFFTGLRARNMKMRRMVVMWVEEKLLKERIMTENQYRALSSVDGEARVGGSPEAGCNGKQKEEFEKRTEPRTERAPSDTRDCFFVHTWRGDIKKKREEFGTLDRESLGQKRVWTEKKKGLSGEE